ncbi:hypothetical protein JVT61DRAFT_11788 [Boletus reticuloceps]|uniref:Uncharacterized protein n=1 Tax=Boletus reticuloceps TaxID=495285 RepID=A0A8I2YU27_9AGAM|nr:hypothetical protein JVT61DRAFT_11788 [Boletus reticuloceps]
MTLNDVVLLLHSPLVQQHLLCQICRDFGGGITGALRWVSRDVEALERDYSNVCRHRGRHRSSPSLGPDKLRLLLSSTISEPNSCHDDKRQWTEDTVPTVAFNYRKVRKGAVTLKIWDVAGQPKFRSMWERYCNGVDAVVYVPSSCLSFVLCP